MKKTILPLLLFNFIMLACNSSDDDPINNPEKGPVEIDLVHTDMIRLWNGTSCSFEAIEDGEYSIKSEDTSIATVKVEGKVFTVIAGRPGETNIVINDKAGNETVIMCYSRAFDAVWSENPYLHQIYKNSINVAAADKSVAELIKTELKDMSADNRDNSKYWFIQGADLIITIPPAPSPTNGTYTWDYENRTLTLNYNGITEKYRCDIMPQRPNLFVNVPLLRYILAITKDYTEEYQQKYPDAGIEEVFVIRHMISYDDYWRTERIADNP